VVDGGKSFILPAECLSVFSYFIRENMGMAVNDHGFFSHRPLDERNEIMERWNDGMLSYKKSLKQAKVTNVEN
jgi:hypothetical protein